MSSTIMKYGSYTFDPVPTIKINKQYLKTGDGINRGVTFQMTLNGTLSVLDPGTGLQGLITKKNTLREAFNADGKYFQLLCGETTLLETYPRIISLDFLESTNNWVFTIPYTLVIEYENDPADENLSGFGEDTSLHPPHISDFNENWNIEFSPTESNPYSLSNASGVDANPFVVRFSHDVNAVGKSHYSGPGLSGALDKPAWQQARDYVSGYLGFNSGMFLSQVGINLENGIWTAYDHYRVQSTNESQGSFGVQESWTVLGDRGGIERAAIEDFVIDIQKDQNAEFNRVNIQGTVRGLEGRVYDPQFSVTGFKYTNASGYFNSIRGSKFIFPRVDAFADLESITLNPQPVIESVSHSPNQGIISYNYSYDDRPTNCIAGAKFENIEISDNNPTDVFASIRILGRTQGPILQSFNTVTEFSRTVSIEALMNPNTGCTNDSLLSGNNPKSQVEGLLCTLQTSLENEYTTVFKSSDQETWRPKTGRYSRTVVWTATDCNDSPSTDFCS